MTDSYIERILRARVYDVAMESPLEPAPRLSRRVGNNILFKREDLQRPFDKQINKLLQLIDTQLQTLYRKFPAEQIAHLVLSGGLGNSAYVQARLRQHYSVTSIPNARGISVRIAPDPQLAVCKGLVADRIRKLITSHSVLGWRCCRSSYGTMCKIMYDKKNPDHVGKQLVRDPLNGKMYIMQAIAWFGEYTSNKFWIRFLIPCSQERRTRISRQTNHSQLHQESNTRGPTASLPHQRHRMQPRCSLSP